VEFPFWIVIVCHLAIALGTMTGGWRIVKTMGMKLTKLRPYGGACAETAAAISLFTSARLGVPVSTTHTITGAIVGVGTVQRFSAVRWGIATRVVWAWVLTIPMSGLVGATCYALLRWIRWITVYFPRPRRWRCSSSGTSIDRLSDGRSGWSSPRRRFPTSS
jgi:PiT family inorganic phosphate transporter